MKMTDTGFLECVEDILEHPQYRRLQNYYHHSSSILDHCLQVAYLSYVAGGKVGLDQVALARGGMLHDFFLYDWRKDRFHGVGDFKNSHAFRHPVIALRNAEKYFQLSDLERDMIVKHMWPATLCPPKYKESLLLCGVDKYVACREYIKEQETITPEQLLLQLQMSKSA